MQSIGSAKSIKTIEILSADLDTSSDLDIDKPTKKNTKKLPIKCYNISKYFANKLSHTVSSAEKYTRVKSKKKSSYVIKEAQKIRPDLSTILLVEPASNCPT